MHLRLVLRVGVVDLLLQFRGLLEEEQQDDHFTTSAFSIQ